jgi:hypothetical protein
MKVSWADVNHTETPGKFSLFGGVLEVRERHIAIWKSTPTAIFSVVRFMSYDDNTPRYALAGYEVPEKN